MKLASPNPMLARFLDRRVGAGLVSTSPPLGPMAAVLLLVLAAAMAIPLRADSPPEAANSGQPLKQLSLADLGNVEVTTTSKKPEEVWKTAAAIYVLTQEDIRRSGATSLPELLRLVPGVEVARVNSNQWSVGIRGFGSSFSKSVLVLIDGRSVYTPLYAGVYWDVQNVMLDDVERIEVIRGPGGTIWGSNAVNGVINIITKNSQDTQGADTSVRGGNLDQAGGAARYGGHGKNFDYRVYGMGFGRAPEFHQDGDNYDDWQMGQAGFRADSNLTDRDALTIQGDVYKGDVGQQVSIAYDSPLVQKNVDGTQEVSGGNFLGRWRHSISDTSDFQIQGYYDRTYRAGPQFGEARSTFDLDFIHHLVWKGRNDIVWGLGARWSPSTFEQTVPTVDFAPHHQSDNIYSAFVQDQFAIVKDKLWLTVGSKFEHNIFTGWENEPSGRLLWTPTAHQSFWGAITRTVRTPSRIDEDLQLTGLVSAAPIPIFLCICDHGKFKSETMLGYEAGYRRLVNSRFYVDFAAFHNHYNDLTNYGDATISLIPTPPPFAVLISIPFANGIMGSTQGGEIAPDLKLTRWMEVKASYSYVSLDLLDRPTHSKTAYVSAYEGASPHNEATAQILFNLPKGFEFDPAYRYVGALPSLAVNSYQTADARLGWHFAKQFELSVTGQNLFQPRHAESGSVLVERTAYAQITWKR
jgi:iron complex outermembrane receptor protein